MKKIRLFGGKEIGSKSISLRAGLVLSHVLVLFLICTTPAVSGVVGNNATLTLEAQEQFEGSCPWIFPWDGNNFTKDNDIYSVARYQTGEYEDFYILQKPLLPHNGTYMIEIREVENESSWTDSVGLIAVDHAADVIAGVDDKGNVSSYRQNELIMPVFALDNNGNNISGLLGVKDAIGFEAYSESYAEVDFGYPDLSEGARVVLKIKGFIQGAGVDHPYIGQPAIVLQAFVNNSWIEIGKLRPRFDWTEGVFDISEHVQGIPGSLKIRLYSISHGTKYHAIDFVGLSVGAQPVMDIKELPLFSAIFKGTDVSDVLSYTDSNYLNMTAGEKFEIAFTESPQTHEKRDFIFVSKGYYIPKDNTYYIYTWDGTDWVERDSYSYSESDEQHTFDLSTYLPDPAGKYRVRIFQNYIYSPASIDYIGLEINSSPIQLDTATDLKHSVNIRALVMNSDDIRFDMFDESMDGNRWSEYEWMPLTDLTGSWMTLYSVNRGKNLSGLFRELNLGGTAGAHKVSFYLSDNGRTLGKLLNTYSSTGLGGGMSKTITFSYVSTLSLSGKYVITVIDTANAVSETNEGNNRFARKIP